MGIITVKFYYNSILLNSKVSKFLINHTGIYSRNPEKIGFKDIASNNLNSLGLTILGSFTFGMSTFTQLTIL